MSWTNVHGPDCEPVRSPGVVSGHKSRVRVLTWSCFFVFIIGFLTAFKVELIGVVHIGEIVLAFIALWAVLANLSNPRFWDRTFAVPLFFLCLTLSGYVLSDLV